jgi:hypothetical protein
MPAPLCCGRALAGFLVGDSAKGVFTCGLRPGGCRAGWPGKSGGWVQDLAAGAEANSPQKSSAPTYG